MQEFTFYSPTKVLFGPDAEWQVGQEVKRFGGTRALLVYGGGSAVQKDDRHGSVCQIGKYAGRTHILRGTK